MTKALTPTENPKKQSDNTNTPPLTSIAQRLLAVLGRSVGVTAATQRVWCNWFTKYQSSLEPQERCDQKDTQKQQCLTISFITIKHFYQLTYRISKTILRYEGDFGFEQGHDVVSSHITFKVTGVT